MGPQVWRIACTDATPRPPGSHLCKQFSTPVGPTRTCVNSRARGPHTGPVVESGCSLGNSHFLHGWGPGIVKSPPSVWGPTRAPQGPTAGPEQNIPPCCGPTQARCRKWLFPRETPLSTRMGPWNCHKSPPSVWGPTRALPGPYWGPRAGRYILQERLVWRIACTDVTPGAPGSHLCKQFSTPVGPTQAPL